MSKVAVIEGSFMYHFSQQYEGKSVDYAALRQLLIEEFGVDRIYIHNCVKRNTEHGIVKLHDFLATNGFSSRLHHAREFGDNVDYDISNELTVNLVAASKFAEEIIVVSTNNNLNPMIEYLSENGTIFSQLAVNPNGKMKRIYDNIFNLDDFADTIMVDKVKPAA